jgi:L-serine deaminase
MQEAMKGFRRLKAYKHLRALRAALAKQSQRPPSDEVLVQIAEAA